MSERVDVYAYERPDLDSGEVNTLDESVWRAWEVRKRLREKRIRSRVVAILQLVFIGVAVLGAVVWVAGKP